MRPLLFLLLILSFSATVTAQDAAKVQLERSISLFKEKRYREALIIQQKLVREHPDNALYRFNEGTSAFMSGKFSLAKKSFNKVEQLKSPMAPAAKLYRAKAELALKNRTQARVLFQELAADKSLPPGIRVQAEDDLRMMNPALSVRHEAIMKLYQAQRFREALELIEKNPEVDSDMQMLRGLLLVKLGKPVEAHELLSEIPESADGDRVSLLQYLIDQTKRDERSRKPYWAFLEATGGYNSNSYFESTEDGGILGALYTKNYLGGGARLLNRGSWAAMTAYSGSWEEVANAGNLKVLSHQLQANATYDSPLDYFQAGPYLQYDEWGNVPSIMKTGARLKYRRMWSTSAAGAEIEMSSIHSQRARYSYLGGSDFSTRLHWAMDTKRVYGQVYLDYQKARVGDYVYPDKTVLPIASETLGPGVRVLYRQSKEWLYSSQGYFKRRNYSTLSSPGNVERKDREYGIGIRGTRVWNQDLASYASLTYIHCDSTLGAAEVRDENFSATVVTVGLLWDIL